MGEVPQPRSCVPRTGSCAFRIEPRISLVDNLLAASWIRHPVLELPMVRFLFWCLLAAALPTPAQAAASRVLTSCPCSSHGPLASMRPRATSALDGAGGTYLTWVDGGVRVRVLRIGAELGAAAGWAADGWTPAVEPGGWHQLQPTLIPDGEAGVYVAWIDQDESLDLSLRLTRLRADGRPREGWPATGLRVSGPSSWVWRPALAPMPGNGVVVVWSEVVREAGVVRAIAFEGNGQPTRHWPADGLVLGTTGSID